MRTIKFGSSPNRKRGWSIASQPHGNIMTGVLLPSDVFNLTHMAIDNRCALQSGHREAPEIGDDQIESSAGYS